MTSVKNITREIIGHLESEPIGGLRRHEVQKRLGHVDTSYFRTIFARLIADGTIVKKRGGRYVAARSRSLYRGVLTLNQRGFGFIKPDNGKADIFVPQENLLGGISGDHVQYVVEQGEQRPCGRIVKVLEHARKDFVGALVEQQGGYAVRPLRRDLPPLVKLFQNGLKAELNGAKPGDWVKVSFVPRTDERAPLTVAIAKRLAKSATITGDIRAICEEYGLPSLYSGETEQRAAALKPQEIPREDCLELEAFTIDPMDARDFDDAISVRKLPKGMLEVGVHIADVACYVHSGSPLDRAARRRGFTSYLPGRTISMLPLALSADLCSLREGEERLAHSVFLHIDATSGEVISSRRVHTRIRSRHRLCYEQVEHVLKGEVVDGIDAKLAKTLNLLGDVTHKMREQRAVSEQFIPFEGLERKVLCTGNPPQVTDIMDIRQGAASELVEELMLAANVEVAKEMRRRNLPCLYRNHLAPSGEQLHTTTELAEKLLHRRKVRLTSRHHIAAFLDSIRHSEYSDVLNMLLLRCMPRAQYGVVNHGHFGLGKEIYCHFTSPIRRYPDLLVHRQLIAADTGAALMTTEFLAEQELSCNALEVNNDQAYFALEDRLKLRLIRERQEQDSGFSVECTVLKAIPSGLSLYVPEYGMMAFISIEDLFGHRWHYDAKTSRITDGRSSYCFGSTIFARPSKMDTVRNELLMKPVTFRI
ncbi:MAG: RNB domain-containing ribonuclease [Victivallales bacterium]|nr:RNB domain-containing ribonuclease [Victivallales bacterium]